MLEFGKDHKNRHLYVIRDVMQAKQDHIRQFYFIPYMLYSHPTLYWQFNYDARGQNGIFPPEPFRVFLSYIIFSLSGHTVHPTVECLKFQQ